MKKKQLKILGFVVLAILLLNLLFFALRIIGQVLFWAVIAAGAVFVYKVLPRINR